MQARTSGIDSGAYSDLNRLGQYKVGGDSEANIQKAAQEFESLFSMKCSRPCARQQRCLPKATCSAATRAKLYQDMYDQQLSVTLSEKGAHRAGRCAGAAIEQAQGPCRRRGSLGIQQAEVPPAVTASQMNTPSAWPSCPGRLTCSRLPTRPPATTSGWFPRSRRSRTPEDFAGRLDAPHAENAARELGVSPRVLLAQAALETGWGRHVMRGADGDSSHNLFGIKADAQCRLR